MSKSQSKKMKLLVASLAVGSLYFMPVSQAAQVDISYEATTDADGTQHQTITANTGADTPGLVVNADGIKWEDLQNNPIEFNDLLSAIKLADAGIVPGQANTAYGAIAIGEGSKANLWRGTAVGYNSNAQAEASTAIGGDSSAAIDGTAVGYANKAVMHGTSIGSHAAASGYDSAAVGYNAQAKVKDSIALGANSIASVEKTVSVGNDTLKRKVVNVADGEIAEGSHDAVTGNQLYTTNQKLDTLDTQAVKWDEGTTNQIKGVVFNDHGSVTVNNATIKGGFGAALTDPNDITTAQFVVNGATGEVRADGGVLTKGDVVANEVDADGNVLNSYSLKDVGADLEAYKVAGVVPGTLEAKPGDTVNNSIALGANSKVTGNNSIAIGGQALSSADVALGQDSVASGVNATAIGNNSHATAGQSTALGQNAWATANGAVALGNNSVANEANTVSVGSKDNERKIVNVAAGEKDTDAVNMGQLNATNANVTANADKLAAYEKAGVVPGTNEGQYNVVLGDSSFVSGQNSVAVGRRASVNANFGTAIGDNAQVYGVNSVAIGSDSVASENNVVSVGSKDQERKIVNVKAGTADTDAVNYGQLKEANGDIQDLDKKIGSADFTKTNYATKTQNVTDAIYAVDGQVKAIDDIAVKYDSKEKDTITFEGADGTALKNISSIDAKTVNAMTATIGGVQFNGYGRIQNVNDAVQDNDAVNLGQLKKYQTAATTEVKGDDKNITVGSSVDETDGHKIYTVTLDDEIEVTSVKSETADLGGVKFQAGQVYAANDYSSAWMDGSGFYSHQGDLYSDITPGKVAVGNGTNRVEIDGSSGTINGLSNKTFDVNAMKGSGNAATEAQVEQAYSKAVEDAGTAAGTVVKEAVGDQNYTKVEGTELKDGMNLTDAIGTVNNKVDAVDKKVGNLSDLNDGIEGDSIVDSINKVDTKIDDKINSVSGDINGVKDRVTAVENKTSGITYDEKTQTTTIGGKAQFNEGGITMTGGGDVATENGSKLSTLGKTSDLDEELTKNDKYTSNQTVVGAVNAEADIRRNEVARIDSNVSALSGRVDSLESRMGDVEERIDKVGAMSAAIANLRTMGFDPEAPTEIAVGVGQYKSETGLALGVFHYPNQDFMLSASVSTSGDEVMGGIGATWKIGRKTAAERARISEEKAAEKAAEIKAAAAKAAKDAEVNAQREKHAQLLAQREAAHQDIHQTAEKA